MQHKLFLGLVQIFLVISLSIVHAETTTYDLAYDQVGNLQQSFDKYLEYNEFNQVVRVRENNAQGQILEKSLENIVLKTFFGFLMKQRRR